MTAPLTPSNQPPSDPWQAPHHGATSDLGAPAPRDPGEVRKEWWQSALLLPVLAVAGLVLGLLWWQLAPHIPLVSDGKAVYLKDSEGEQAAGVDGTFTLLALGLGVLSGALVFWRCRRNSVAVVIALTLGGLIGSVVGWRLGVVLGPTDDVVAHAKEVGKGITFSAPISLEAKGALLVWPIAALAAHLGLNGLFGPRDPEPEPVAYRPSQGTAPGNGEGERLPARDAGKAENAENAENAGNADGASAPDAGTETTRGTADAFRKEGRGD